MGPEINIQDMSHWSQQFLSSDEFQEFINAIPEMVILSDYDGDVIRLNHSAIQHFGYSQEEFLKLKIEALVPEEVRSNHVELRHWFFKNPRPRFLENRNYKLEAVKADKSTFPMDAALFAIHTNDGPVAVNLIRDLTKQKAHEQEITQMAFVDALTGLPNRRYFDANIERIMAKSDRHNLKAGLMFIDLDHFKPINDSHGHDQGDALLRMISKRLSSLVRAEDFLARIGGDEFVIIQFPVEDDANMEVAAQKILEACKMTVELGGEQCQISASIGLAVSNDPKGTVHSLFHESDQAMYCAKRKGGNCFSWLVQQ